MPIFEQSVEITAPPAWVDQCITDRDLMHRWLNPLLRCESVGAWSVEPGHQFRFILNIPLVEPTLNCVVRERGLYLIEWGFTGFFEGSDRWECQPLEANGTRLLNRFTFEIPNPLIQAGFSLVAADFTKRDMVEQLQRLKRVAETFPPTATQDP